jgi:hypothetical protein
MQLTRANSFGDVGLDRRLRLGRGVDGIHLLCRRGWAIRVLGPWRWRRDRGDLELGRRCRGSLWCILELMLRDGIQLLQR